MQRLIILVALPGVFATPHLERRLDNGLAQTPPLGWNSYNHYNCAVNETVVLSNAQALKDLGLSDLGYTYVTTDCGWTIPHRTDDGKLTWNETLFPMGFPQMGKAIQDMGLKFGIYSDAGIQMCMTGGVNQTGSLYHEQVDAETFAAWGADLLKYDNCWSSAEKGFPNVDYEPETSPHINYVNMNRALNSTNRSILFQICDWGVDFPSAWAPELGNTWRVTNDIVPAWRTIFRIVNQVVPQTDYARPHRWLDLDMLEVGNGIFTVEEERTHFSLWSILKSPLTIGCALNDTFTSISDDSLAVLSNKNVLEFNQDALGVAANLTRRWSDEGYDVWSGPLSDGRMVAALVNWNNFTIDATLDLPDIGLQSAGYVKDAWTNTTRTNVQTSYHAKVAPHDTLLLEIGDTIPAGKYLVNGKSGEIKIPNIYGFTTSSSYNMKIHFSKPAKQDCSIDLHSSHSNSPQHHTPTPGKSITEIPVSLIAGNNNTITLHTSQPISYITITGPLGVFHPSTSFTLAGPAKHQTCPDGLCIPVGSKVTNLSQNSSAILRLPSQHSNTKTPAKRYVEITYINNDVAISTSWGEGRNARNITISVNGEKATRLETPLSGRSSELFSVMKGWGDAATLGVLVGGWGGGEDGMDTITVSNVDGDVGVEPYGADFVGLKVY